MKKHLFITILFLGMAGFATKVKSQSVAEIKEKQELLKVYSELFNKNLELAKEKENNVKIAAEVNSLNKKSDRKTDKFTSSDPNSTSQDAKNTAKLLKKTESANKDLLKSNTKIKSIEAEISRIVTKMESYKYVIEIKNK